MGQAERRLAPGRATRWGCRAAAGLAILFGLGQAATFGAPSALAQDDQIQGGLIIELNKVENLDGGCMASFVFQNTLGATLDRFNLDLFLFDGEGVILRRVTIDMAPLLDGKTRVAQFRLHDGPCAEIGRVLVNDFPQCRAETGEPVDCLAGLAVSSRSAIELDK